MTAILSIQVDANNSFDVRFSGEEKLQLSMIGALRFAEDYLRERINKRATKIADETCNSKNGIYNSKQEKIVTKQEAISHLLDLHKIIESRIDAVNSSDPRATFTIDEELISKI